MSKAFDLSKKTDLTSRDGLQSKASNTSCVIGSNWLRNKSYGRKPDWLGFNSISSKRKFYNLLKIIFSKNIPNIGKREIGR